MFDLRWMRPSRQPSGTHIKKLMAKEMSQETESRRMSQSIIARLMGLEGSPPQQLSQRQQRMRSKESGLTAKEGKTGGGSPFSSGRSSRRSSREEQKFKDVYEVVEASKVERSGCQSQGTARSKVTSDEMAFIRQKFMEAKRLSTDDKLQDSKEFQETIEVLDSNKDLLLKFLQQPDSLFTKHLSDLEGAPLSQSYCRRIARDKAAKDHDFEVHYGLKSGKEKLPRKSRRPSKHKNNHSCHPYSSPDSLMPLKLDGRMDSDILPTRIVILKPNLGKFSHSAKSPPSPASHSLLSDNSSLEEFPGFRYEDIEQTGRTKLSGIMDLGLLSKGTPEIAEETTMKMKSGYDSGSPSIFPLKLRPYGGDDPSTTPMNDSANEYDITLLISSKSSDWNNQRKHAFHSAESSMTREANRRHSRRWDMTHRSHEFNFGGTLADMLSIHDQTARCSNADTHTRRKVFSGEDLSAACDDPLGISSRDGWKDMCINNLTKSRSVPSLSSSCSSRENKILDAPYNLRHTMPREAINWEKNKKILGRADSRDALASRKRRSGETGHHSRHFIRGESSSASEAIHPRQNLAKFVPVEFGLLRGSPVSEASTTMSIAQEDFAVEDERMFSSRDTSSINHTEHSQQEQLYGSSKETPDRVHHPTLRVSPPKEADQPSPISTLETPFSDDLSCGSECFESLSADLRGLRLQLQLLKLESGAYGQEAALISGDEGTGERPGGSSEENTRHKKNEESWESSYVRDILVHSGFIDYDPTSFATKLHSLDSPVDPSTFEDLEKRVYHETCSSRPERRLLFDRLNSELNEIYQELTDTYPWATLGMQATLGHRLGNDDKLLDRLCRSLVDGDKQADKGSLDEALTDESQWLNLRGDLDTIGKEIGRVLVDDIVVEVVVELM
ncbi:hypothetical protein SAY87_008947 [Trapa incisa]|uniref:DUF4378 domain-containing protein n=1 Tax=Trapa incisa TaxID=236973 RepID=A0AAN7JUE2_9MYRT|nr:hypothetical protein SAY87_008947 [Trapa incisa]